MILDNENILRLIYKNYANYHDRQLLNKTVNQTISKIILGKMKNFSSIYKSIGKNNLYLTHKNFILFFALLPNNNVITATNDNKLNLWSLEDYQCIKPIKVEDNLTSLILLPHYKLITTTTDSFIKARSINEDFKTTACLHLEAYSGLNNLLFLSNEKIACSAVHSNGYAIIIFDYSNEKITKIKDLIKHESWITQMINLSK
jgi:WD40 repeat protein